MGLDQSGFLRSLSLLREEVPDFGVYPFSIPAIRTLDTLELDPGATFLVGPNGSGKSTLVEAIAVAAGCNPEGGSQSFNFSTRASHSDLHDHIRLTRGVRRPRGGYFLRPRASSTSPPRSTDSRKRAGAYSPPTAGARCTSSPTESPSSRS